MTTEDLKRLQDEFSRSDNTRETDITLFGGKMTVVEIVTLLAYIRNAINSNRHVTINLEIGKNVDNDVFNFTVNGEQIDDLRVAENFNIN